MVYLYHNTEVLLMEEVEPEDHHETIILATGCGCCTVEVIQRCRKAAKCEICQSLWIRGLYGKFCTRKRRSGHAADKAILWTLGTSCRDTEHGRALLGESWRLFRMRMDNYTDWSPIFRVVETGSKGGRLHIHFVETAYLEHETVLEAWRSVTGESANVNFSYIYGEGSENSFDDILPYLLKYLLKDGSKYSWLGAFYKAGAGVRPGAVCEHGKTWEFPDFPREWDVCDEQFYNR